MHYYAAWLGTVEGTNVFLGATFGMVRLGLQDNPWVQRWFVGLLVSFFTLRIISLPMCIYSVNEALSHNMLRPFPEGGTFWDDDLLFFRIGQVSIVFLWGLSSWWFSKMVKGALRRSRAAKKDKNGKNGTNGRDH